MRLTSLALSIQPPHRFSSGFTTTSPQSHAGIWQSTLCRGLHDHHLQADRPGQRSRPTEPQTPSGVQQKWVGGAAPGHLSLAPGWLYSVLSQGSLALWAASGAEGRWTGLPASRWCRWPSRSCSPHRPGQAWGRPLTSRPVCSFETWNLWVPSVLCVSSGVRGQMKGPPGCPQQCLSCSLELPSVTLSPAAFLWDTLLPTGPTDP